MWYAIYLFSHDDDVFFVYTLVLLIAYNRHILGSSLLLFSHNGFIRRAVHVVIFLVIITVNAAAFSLLLFWGTVNVVAGNDDDIFFLRFLFVWMYTKVDFFFTQLFYARTRS